LVVAIVGSGIAVGGAFWLAARTFKQERAREQERQHREERERYKRILVSLMGDITQNEEAIDLMLSGEWWQFPLRVRAFEQNYGEIGFLPLGVGEDVQGAMLAIDRYNAAPNNDSLKRQALVEAKEALDAAGTLLAGHLRDQGFMEDEHTIIPGP
jgi:hypothetical protein